MLKRNRRWLKKDTLVLYFKIMPPDMQAPVLLASDTREIDSWSITELHCCRVGKGDLLRGRKRKGEKKRLIVQLLRFGQQTLGQQWRFTKGRQWHSWLQGRSAYCCLRSSYVLVALECVDNRDLRSLLLHFARRGVRWTDTSRYVNKWIISYACWHLSEVGLALNKGL